jgi:dTDP-4-dehydrorhamnose reductase
VERETGKRILILGGSGFLGQEIYKELCNYYNTFATYNSSRHRFEQNSKYLRYDVTTDDLSIVLKQIKPDIVISALRGPFEAQLKAHLVLSEHIKDTQIQVIFLSSSNVFDAYSKFPSYELDKTLSESIYGRFKIHIENMLLRIPMEQMVIARLPMVFGNASPRIREIKQALELEAAIEVFPNLILNVTTADKVCQQLHYIINQNRFGIFHLGSSNLVHHEDFIQEICAHLSPRKPLLKRVYTTNNERYLAVLPKHNNLPENLRFTYQEVIAHHIPK